MGVPSPVTLITGGHAGLGAAISMACAEQGHRVFSFGPADDGVAEAEAAIRASGGAILAGDIRDGAAVASAVAQVTAVAGRIDGLVCNAAYGPLGTVLDTDEAEWDRIMAINVKGAYLFARAVVPVMRAQGGGAIVMVGSGAGWGKPNMAAYAASKGALYSLASAMAYDHFYDRIRVNIVIPGGGGIVSGMSLARVGGDRALLGRGTPGSVAGRPVTGADLAAAVCFLLSDAAGTISGTVLDVGCFAHQGGPVPVRTPSVEQDLTGEPVLTAQEGLAR